MIEVKEMVARDYTDYPVITKLNGKVKKDYLGNVMPLLDIGEDINLAKVNTLLFMADYSPVIIKNEGWLTSDYTASFQVGDSAITFSLHEDVRDGIISDGIEYKGDKLSSKTITDMQKTFFLGIANDYPSDLVKGYINKETNDKEMCR